MCRPLAPVYFRIAHVSEAGNAGRGQSMSAGVVRASTLSLLGPIYRTRQLPMF